MPPKPTLQIQIYPLHATQEPDNLKRPLRGRENERRTPLAISCRIQIERVSVEYGAEVIHVALLDSEEDGGQWIICGLWRKVSSRELGGNPGLGEPRGLGVSREAGETRRPGEPRGLGVSREAGETRRPGEPRGLGVGREVRLGETRGSMCVLMGRCSCG
ncbi:hypothetical protein BC938DRAFT_475979 [Jimgerdemannia flammicorona]|uniref:Uncharacterized protein n=1 Tax=Jimgerdemannia flammicorona TaxID=994334 RepID=A0A433QR54_9FUNG|nr:hypothetical protein BC938DRAFT_475979 [Jimgerdemannia flammicorona]